MPESVRFRCDIRKHPYIIPLGFCRTPLYPTGWIVSKISPPEYRCALRWRMVPCFRCREANTNAILILRIAGIQVWFHGKLRVYNAMFATLACYIRGWCISWTSSKGQQYERADICGGIDWDLGQDNFMTLNIGYSYQLDFTGVTSKSPGNMKWPCGWILIMSRFFTWRKRKARKSIAMISRVRMPLNCFNFSRNENKITTSHNPVFSL